MRTLIMGKERLQRTLARLAHEVVERNRGASELVVFGIARKGIPVAEALAQHIRDIEGLDVRAHALDVRPFRDDRESSEAAQTTPSRAVEVTGQHVLLADDVLFSGRTARAALDAIVRYGRPASIQLVVLVDRGHREVPIQADYVGRTIPTKHRECVVVEFSDSPCVYIEE